MNTEQRPLLQQWADTPGCNVAAYTKVEIAAEKLRCVLQRRQCRYFLDLDLLLGEQDPVSIADLFRKKATHRGLDPATFAEKFEKRVHDYEGRWDAEVQSVSGAGAALRRGRTPRTASAAKSGADLAREAAPVGLTHGRVADAMARRRPIGAGWPRNGCSPDARRLRSAQLRGCPACAFQSRLPGSELPSIGPGATPAHWRNAWLNEASLGTSPPHFRRLASTATTIFRA